MQWIYAKNVCWLWSIFFVNDVHGNMAWFFSENSFCQGSLRSDYLQTEMNLGFHVGRERLFICLFNTSIPYWSWAFSKVIAQNLCLLDGSWSWRFKRHRNWLLGIFIVLFKNRRSYVKVAPLCSLFEICNNPFSIETVKQTRQMQTTGNWASVYHLKLSCFQVPKVPSVTYIKLLNNSA